LLDGKGEEKGTYTYQRAFMGLQPFGERFNVFAMAQKNWEKISRSMLWIITETKFPISALREA
jgi:hypothetical protein